MIHIYDGNNVRMRAMTQVKAAGADPLSLRQVYEDMATPVNNDAHIWCWDGFNHNQRRKEIYPLYKAQREPVAEDMFAQIKLFKELLTYTPTLQIECEGWEGDDIVATVAREAARRGNKVTCYSNDLDYLQLERNPLIKIIGIGKKPCEPRWVCLFKALVGDPADNIKGVPGFGPGAWAALYDDLDQVEMALRHDNPKGLSGLPFSNKVFRWLQEPENFEQVRNMFTITHLFTVPDDELQKGLKQGTSDRTKAEDLLGRYFL